MVGMIRSVFCGSVPSTNATTKSGKTASFQTISDNLQRPRGNGNKMTRPPDVSRGAPVGNAPVVNTRNVK